jgi:hypothetical protein
MPVVNRRVALSGGTNTPIPRSNSHTISTKSREHPRYASSRPRRPGENVIMRSGYDPTSYEWDSEHYQAVFRQLIDLDFRRLDFMPQPALGPGSVRRDRSIAVEYDEQEFDPKEFEVTGDAWSHQHCKSCLFTITPGHSYWQNRAGEILCDQCHDYVERNRDRFPGRP